MPCRQKKRGFACQALAGSEIWGSTSVGRIVSAWKGAAVCGSGSGVLTNLATALANVDGDDFAHDELGGETVRGFKKKGTNVGTFGDPAKGSNARTHTHTHTHARVSGNGLGGVLSRCVQCLVHVVTESDARRPGRCLPNLRAKLKKLWASASVRVLAG